MIKVQEDKPAITFKLDEGAAAVSDKTEPKTDEVVVKDKTEPKTDDKSTRRQTSNYIQTR